MTLPVFTTPTSVIPDAEHLYIQLLAHLRAHMATCVQTPIFIGIHRGGAWLAERLHADLGISEPLGTIDISFYRDDFATKGISTNVKTTDVAIDLNGRDVILCDDILNSGRSVRAALNEIFDFGRPAQVDLAVLFDRGGRELPVAAQFVGGQTEFDAAYKLVLERDASNRFCFRVPRREVVEEVETHPAEVNV
ncbi:bifunctional pyr operon transcriptional regulator/uracil phosphoribosyltransferase PyrR [Hydromonas duriensis]|uniref:Pyrimidine operon attenuation protein/uracil phosphoribosyltransferase n=1 Tax=Hydromonas duriensis TaxID=1527608 RepID=A0A4R6Y792_9BURK|nr:bifunctional pyr operon transcriptional regulator/uracil phosphoribosyltransferase PyrR [Hydromonas duriensis]TDR31182.1 pyrimidine operon attenuation protein/uracil phosphoribosyltransferase [Hydromonas duriensis]